MKLLMFIVLITIVCLIGIVMVACIKERKLCLMY